MTPSEQIDALARAYYHTLHEGDCSPPYDELNAGRQEKQRRAVRALLLCKMEIEDAIGDRLTRPMPPRIPAEPPRRLAMPPPGPAVPAVMTESARVRLVERLQQKQRAGS